MSTETPPPPLSAWERRDNESDRAFEAFEVYRTMGLSRSLARVAEKLGKSTTIIERWSSRDNWRTRVAAWDRNEAKAINERVLQGTAAMRERNVNQALSMQAKAQARLLRMSQKDIDRLAVKDVVALMRAATDLERKARDIPESELDQAERDSVPNFTVQFVGPAGMKEMLGVRLEDGQVGYIPRDQLARFQADHPKAVVINK